MAVTVTVSTYGGYKVFTSTNATLATAISEVINELEDQNLNGEKVKFNTTFDANNNVFAVVAYVGGSPGTRYT